MKMSKQIKNSLNLLYEINEYINQTSDIKVILKGILKIIKDFFLYDILFLYLWDSEKNKIILEASTVKDFNLEFNPGEGLAGTIFQTKQIVSSRNIVKHPHYRNVFEPEKTGYVHYLGVPVMLQSYCSGILEIWNKKDNSITQNQGKIIRIICSRISGLLEVSEILERFKSPKMVAKSTATYYGFPLSKGISFGKSYIIPELFQNEYFEIKENTIVDIEIEKRRLNEGFTKAIQEMEILIKNLKENKKVSDSGINIFQAHLMILRDQEFQEDIKNLIETKKIKAEICVSEYIEGLTTKFKNMDDPYFRDRAYDFLDIGQRIIMIMQSQYTEMNLSLSLPEDSIIIAEYISPSLLVSLDKSKIKGIAVEKGGRSSHTAILAQSLNIPAVSEIADINHLVPQNVPVLLDGNHGVVIVNPEDKAVLNYQNEMKKEDYIRSIFEQKTGKENSIQQKIKIAANISFMQDIQWAQKYNIQSVGLYRSEFFFMKFSSWPGINDQIAVYKELAGSFKGEVTIRLLDVGADKTLPYLNHKAESNPLLGLRSVRFLLKNPDLLYSQLAAILSLYEKYPRIKILLPMVTTMEEIESVHNMLTKIKKETHLTKTPQFGIMIEVPSVLYQIEEISKHADFFSIGTNDLIQYLLAVDRESGSLRDLYSGFQPSVIRMLSQLNKEIKKTGKKVTVCGEIAGNPPGALCLIALGYKSLSIYPARAPVINYLCSFLTDKVLDQIKQTVLSLKDKQSIKNFLKESLIAFDPIFTGIN